MDAILELKTRLKELARFIFVENFNVIGCFFIITLAGVLAYRNAFGTPFIFDDITQILENTKIQSLQWPWAFIENNRRPLLYASLALNFHSGAFNPFTYHVFNLRVHILAGIMLFFLVRKTLLLPVIKSGLRDNANLLALASAVLWLLHPVHTQAVTYIIQRAESLMGLFFLSAMYCSSQYLTSKRSFWLVAAGISALLAGLTKEVTLVLPLMVLFYDRTFISKDFRTAWKDHRPLYTALSFTLAVMIYLYLTTKPEERLTAGFGMQGMSPLVYLINQPAVILHYAGLTLWPHDLVFDYEWPPVTQLHVLLPSIVVLLSWVIVLAVAYRRYRGFSFLLLSFLVLLLPSSSVIPLKDLIFEYRLYLSLSCWAVASVLVLHFLTERFVNQRNRKAFFVVFVAAIALILGGLTYQRNKIYADEETVWHDVIRKQPFNARAFNNLGEYLMRHGRDEEAKPYFLQALALNTSYPDVYVNLATVVGKEGHPEEAIEYAKQALALDPHFPVAENNWGSALSQMGRYSEAIPHFEKALELGFVKAGVLQNLGVAYANSGQPFKAVTALKKALDLSPGSKEIQSLLNEVLSSMHP